MNRPAAPILSVENIKTIALIGALVSLFFSVRQCRSNAGIVEDEREYRESLDDTITILKNGIAQKPAVEVSPEMFRNIVKERDDLRGALIAAEIKAKEVRSFTQVSSKIVLGDNPIVIPLSDTITLPSEWDFSAVGFDIDSANYQISGSVSPTEVTITKINFPDSLSVITATKRRLFRRDEFLVSVAHSNPLIKTVGVTNLTISDKKKWWESGWIKTGVGLVTGIYISQKLLK